MRDEQNIVQLFTISPLGGEPTQLTHNEHDIGSAFTWSREGKFIAHVYDHSVCLTETATGKTTRLTPRTPDETTPRPEACVLSPDGSKVAYVRRMFDKGEWFNQIFVCNTSQ